MRQAQLTNDEMGLKPNLIDLVASSLDLRDKVLCSGGLGTGVLNAVVIVDKLDLQVRLLDGISSSLECELNI